MSVLVLALQINWVCRIACIVNYWNEASDSTSQPEKSPEAFNVEKSSGWLFCYWMLNSRDSYPYGS